MEVDDYLSSILQDFKLEDGFYSGFMESVDEYSDFQDTLKALGYSFAVRDSRKYPHEDREKSSFVYSHERGEIKIKYLGAPFHLTHVIDMDCSQGPHILKKKKLSNIQNELAADDPSTSRKRRHHTTKRIGCKAKLYMKRIKIYPEFSIDKFEKNKKSRRQSQNMALLKKEYLNPDRVFVTKERFFIKMSHGDSHSHPTISTNVIQTIHPLLKERIQELATQDGVRTVKQMQLLLGEYVRTMLQTTSIPPPSSLNRCFYPTAETIYSIMYKSIGKLGKCKPAPPRDASNARSDFASVWYGIRQKLRVMTDLTHLASDEVAADVDKEVDQLLKRLADATQRSAAEGLLLLEQMDVLMGEPETDTKKQKVESDPDAL